MAVYKSANFFFFFEKLKKVKSDPNELFKTNIDFASCFNIPYLPVHKCNTIFLTN